MLVAAISCRTCGKTGHQARNCPCFKCGKTGHWAKNCNAGDVALSAKATGVHNETDTDVVMMSPFNINEIHQVHSHGWTLSRIPIHRLLRRIRPSDIDASELSCGCHDRDPILADTLITVLRNHVEGRGVGRKSCEAHECESEAAETLIAEWLIDIVENPLSQLNRAGPKKVCVPFLVGDCFGHREKRYCRAGRHLKLRKSPMSHPLVHGAYEGETGMLVRLITQEEVNNGGKPGQVMAAPILGYDDGGGLTIGSEINLWQKACIYPTTCRRKECRYAHASDYSTT